MAASRHTYPYSEEDNPSRSSQHLPVNAPLLLWQSQEAYPKLFILLPQLWGGTLRLIVEFILNKRTKSKIYYFSLYAACTRPYYRAYLKQSSASYNYCFGLQDVTDESFKVPCAHFVYEIFRFSSTFVHLYYSMRVLPKVSLI